jgi:hypothetical protein
VWIRARGGGTIKHRSIVRHIDTGRYGDVLLRYVTPLRPSEEVLAARRPAVVRRLLESGVTAGALAAVLPEWDDLIRAAARDADSERVRVGV